MVIIIADKKIRKEIEISPEEIEKLMESSRVMQPGAHRQKLDKFLSIILGVGEEEQINIRLENKGSDGMGGFPRFSVAKMGKSKIKASGGGGGSR